MSLETKVQDALKNAMIAKDTVALTTLRGIKAALLLIKTEKGFTGEVSESQEIATLQKMIKQRREAFSIYESQNRADLADKELAEIQVIEQFLPKQLEESEIEEILRDIMKQANATSIKDMGKIIGLANQKIGGRAEGAVIAKIVKGLLQ